MTLILISMSLVGSACMVELHKCNESYKDLLAKVGKL